MDSAQTISSLANDLQLAKPGIGGNSVDEVETKPMQGLSCFVHNGLLENTRIKALYYGEEHRSN